MLFLRLIKRLYKKLGKTQRQGAGQWNFCGMFWYLAENGKTLSIRFVDFLSNSLASYAALPFTLPPLGYPPLPPYPHLAFVVPCLFLNTFCNCVIEMRFHISVFPLMKLKRMRPKKVCFVLLLMQIGFTNFERTRCVNPLLCSRLVNLFRRSQSNFI